MKTALAFVFLAVCFSAQAATLSEIYSSAFGKNLVDTVYLQLKTGDNVQKILELLQQVEDEILQEQSNHDASHNDYQASCAIDIADYRDKIKKAEDDKQLAESKLDSAYPERDRLEADLDTAKTNKANSEKALKDATDLIEEQRATFHTHESELIDAIQIFNEASQIIRNSFGVSFIQTEAGSALANHLSKAKLNAKYTPFLRILAQAASSNKLSQSSIDTIINLFKRLIENAQATLSGERQTMQAREDAYATYSAQLEDEIAGFEKDIENLSARLQIVRANIAQWEKDFEDAENRISTNSQLLADRIDICEKEDKEYNKQTAKRNEELATIDDVQDLISNRIADFTEYITSTRKEIRID